MHPKTHVQKWTFICIYKNRFFFSTRIPHNPDSSVRMTDSKDGSSVNTRQYTKEYDEKVEKLKQFCQKLEEIRTFLKKNCMFISVAGLIGAGKSTLARKISSMFETDLFEEDAPANPYIADFYKDQATYAFNLQVSLLNERFEQQQRIIWSGRPCVQDRSLYEDRIFATVLNADGLMTDRDFETYNRLYKNMLNFMKQPALILWLYVTPEQALQNIKERGRGMESAIPLSYLQKLHDEYERKMHEISRSVQVVKVDWNEFGSEVDVVDALIDQWKGITPQLIDLKLVSD